MYFKDASVASTQFDIPISFPISFTVQYPAILANPIMSNYVQNSKAELLTSPWYDHCTIRITWTQAVTDRRLVWFGFQGCK